MLSPEYDTAWKFPLPELTSLSSLSSASHNLRAWTVRGQVLCQSVLWMTSSPVHNIVVIPIWNFRSKVFTIPGPFILIFWTHTRFAFKLSLSHSIWSISACVSRLFQTPLVNWCQSLLNHMMRFSNSNEATYRCQFLVGFPSPSNRTSHYETTDKVRAL